MTGKFYKGVSYFYNDERKETFRKVLKESIERFGIKLFSWVVLNNHYHILFSINVPDEFHSVQFVNPDKNKWNDEMSQSEFRYTLQKKSIIEFIRKLHKDTSRTMNQLDQTPARKIWYQYFDYSIRNKSDFWKHFNL